MTIFLLLVGLVLVGVAVALGLRAAAMPRIDADKRVDQIRAYGLGANEESGEFEGGPRAGAAPSADPHGADRVRPAGDGRPAGRDDRSRTGPQQRHAAGIQSRRGAARRRAQARASGTADGAVDDRGAVEHAGTMRDAVDA